MISLNVALTTFSPKVRIAHDILTEGEHIVKFSVHNHVPDVAKVEVRKTLAKIKAKAKTTHESTHQIVASTLKDTSTAVAGQLPPVRSI